MASATTIPITHVQGASLTQNVDPDHSQFPSLPVSPEKEQWEFLDRPESPNRTQVSFCPKSISIAEQGLQSRMNPKVLKHAQSSPNLREYCLASSDDDSSDNSSAVFVDDTVSDAGSSTVLVSGPPSVWSSGGAARLSFRDAMLKNKAESEAATADQEATQSKHRKRIKKVKPTFVVKPIKRCNKSTGDLQSMATLDEEVLGDTDAQEYYGRKSLGAQGRKNGLKTRPDEAKRLQITMAKKALQKQRQRG